MAGRVKAIISRKNLEFTPDSHSFPDNSVKDENEFDITVVNESDKFASFQVELSTPGLDDDTNIKWYKVQPEICAKKPSGSETTFHVEIIKAPIPAYDTTIDLFLKVLSVEYDDLYTSQKLRLNIKKPLRSLRLELPVKEFKVSPNELIEIPVIVYNLSSKLSEITLTCAGLDLDWLQFDPDWSNQKQQRIFTIDPADSKKTRFLCQPPTDTLSEEYRFTIHAKSNTSQYTSREQGILKVLPHGVVKFYCNDKEKTISGIGQKSSATYELAFKNESNLPRKVEIIIPEEKPRQCEFITIPEHINLALGETKTIQLVAKKKRPLLGLAQRLLFEVGTNLTSPSSGEPCKEISAEPNTQILALRIFPIIPLLFQILGGTALLLLLLWWILHPRAYHTGPVNSVRFFGNGSLVFSGSSDQTIRRWQVDDSPWTLGIFNLNHKQPLIAEKAQINKAVRVIRQSPKDNDLLGIGLENGEVKLWNLSTDKERTSLAYDNNKANRVFDIAFTQNGRYLFSGHGDGMLNMWDLEKIKDISHPVPENQVNLKFAIYALAINESNPNDPLVFSAGRFNKISISDWQHQRLYELPYKWLDKQKKGQNPVFGQQHYITSLATVNNILASSDNQGYITLWDMNIIRDCLNTPQVSPVTNKNVVQVQTSELISCDAIISQHKSDQPVRSLALTQTGHYLASGGDDGQIIIWSLLGQRSQWLQKEQSIAQSDAKIKSVDINALRDYLLVTSGDNEHNVNLYRVNGVKDDESSK